MNKTDFYGYVPCLINHMKTNKKESFIIALVLFIGCVAASFYSHYSKPAVDQQSLSPISYVGQNNKAATAEMYVYADDFTVYFIGEQGENIFSTSYTSKIEYDKKSVIRKGCFKNLQLSSGSLFAIQIKDGIQTLIEIVLKTGKSYPIVQNVDNYYVFPDGGVLYCCIGSCDYCFRTPEHAVSVAFSYSGQLVFQGEYDSLLLTDPAKDNLFLYRENNKLIQIQMSVAELLEADLVDCCMNCGATCFVFSAGGFNFSVLFPNEELEEVLPIDLKDAVLFDANNADTYYLLTKCEIEALKGSGINYKEIILNNLFSLVFFEPSEGIVSIEFHAAFMIIKDRQSVRALEIPAYHFGALYFECPLNWSDCSEDDTYAFLSSLTQNEDFIRLTNILKEDGNDYLISYGDMSVRWDCVSYWQSGKLLPTGSGLVCEFNKYFVKYGQFPFSSVACKNGLVVFSQNYRWNGDGFSELSLVYGDNDDMALLETSFINDDLFNRKWKAVKVANEWTVMLEVTNWD